MRETTLRQTVHVHVAIDTFFIGPNDVQYEVLINIFTERLK